MPCVTNDSATTATGTSAGTSTQTAFLRGAPPQPMLEMSVAPRQQAARADEERGVRFRMREDTRPAEEPNVIQLTGKTGGRKSMVIQLTGVANRYNGWGPTSH